MQTWRVRLDDVLCAKRMRAVVIASLKRVAKDRGLKFGANFLDGSNAVLVDPSTGLICSFEFPNSWSTSIAVLGYMAVTSHKNLSPAYVFKTKQTAADVLTGTVKDFELFWFPRIKPDAPRVYEARYNVRRKCYAWAASRAGYSAQRKDFKFNLSRAELINQLAAAFGGDIDELSKLVLDPKFVPSAP